MDPNLFAQILVKIRKILKYNYLETFYKEKKLELLSIPSINHKMHLPKLEFNAIGLDPPASNAKNFNLFEKLLTKTGDEIQVKPIT